MHLLQAELAELRAAAAKAVRARAEAAAATTPAMLRRLGAKDLKTWCAAQGLAVTGLLKSELAVPFVDLTVAHQHSVFVFDV